MKRAAIGAFVAASMCAAPGWPQFSAPAASGGSGVPPRVEKVVLSGAADRSAYLPGEAVRVAARLEIEAGWHLQAHVPTYDYLIPTTLGVEAPAGWPAAEVDYPAPSRYKFAFAEDELDVLAGRQRIVARLAVPPGAAAGPVRLTLHLRYQACDDRQCLPPVETSTAVDLQIGAGGVPAAAEYFADTPTPTPSATTPASAPAEAPAAPATPGASVAAPSATDQPAAARSLPAILLLALLGGFILNGMPCVLPILSLKLFGLVQASGKSKRSIRIGALATTAGILASFWALAGAAVLARQAGSAIGWGVQFQQPGFVAFLTVVVLLFSLNLWGLFEIPLPARLARLGDAGMNAGAGDGAEGLAGHFASGLFATLMATPCSAPFLGTALSFALGQSGGTIFAVLTAVGTGLALPYLLLAAAPAAAKWMPRPGAWMLTLRGVMGFLLAGAVVWLVFVLAGQIDSVSLALFELGLLGLSFFLWLRQRAEQERRSTGFWWLLAAATAVGLILFAARATPAAHALPGAASSGPIAWQTFERAEAERLAAAGRLVFLDVTADWCVTCKVNERIVLNAAEVVAAFKTYDVVPMKADWTNRDDGIARFLAEHGRYGIPFYMLYRPGREPHLYGELLNAAEVARVIAESAAAR
ncbi:MAG: thioredoxin family protein [Thermoanaerobaculia bacterium]